MKNLIFRGSVGEVVLTAFFMLIVLPLCGLAQDLKREVDEISAEFLADKNNFGLAVGLIQNGGKQTFYYGGKFCRGTNDVNAETIFELGSITKLYTAYILGALEKDGKLNRFDLLAKYLPKRIAEKNDWAKKIRLIDLATHTSGLPAMDSTKSLAKYEGFDENNPFGIFTEKFILKTLAEIKSVPDYGKVSYSNFGIGLLGIAIEKSSGKSYEELFKSYIIDGFKLNSTHLNLNDEHFTNIALPHRQGETMPFIRLAKLAPSGAGKTTLPELLSFMSVHLAPANGKQTEIVASLLKNQLPNSSEKAALGWGIYEVNGKTVYFHTGGTYGSSSIVIISPETKSGVAIMANSNTEKELTGYALKIMSLLTK
jgi:CubicO group peptidase (beta-lactamase class C family)